MSGLCEHSENYDMIVTIENRGYQCRFKKVNLVTQAADQRDLLRSKH
jgi:hypothetical protein